MRGEKMRLIEKNGVKFIKSDRIISTHAFSTRIGGVSAAAHTAALNLAYSRGDDDETVMANVRIFADAVGFDAETLISVPQIHSASVVPVSSLEAGQGVTRRAEFSCDGYTCAEKGIAIGVKAADCVPVLLEARNSDGRVIAVSAVHAGWRGTVSGIVPEAVRKLTSLGAEPCGIFAAIGPCIHSCCYEVGEDFCKAVREKLGQNYDKKYITPKADGKYFADIVAINKDMLLSMGIPEDNIDVSPYCTCCNTELFYSHRASRGLRGAMMAVIQK